MCSRSTGRDRRRLCIEQNMLSLIISFESLFFKAFLHILGAGKKKIVLRFLQQSVFFSGKTLLEIVVLYESETH